jgi:hypothetical protein
MSKLDPTLPQSGTILIVNNETDSAERVSSTAENIIQTITIPVSMYSKLLIEAIVQERYEVDASNKCNYTWNIKVGGVTQKTFSTRNIALATSFVDSGSRLTHLIDTIIDGPINSPIDITITCTMSINNANCGILVKSIRVWGIIQPGD